jgi:hypothetical protein
VKLEADEALWFTVPTVDRFRWPFIIVHEDHPMLFDPDTGEQAHGLCDYKTRRVYLNGSLSTPSIRETAGHEFAHCVVYDVAPSWLLKSKIAEEVEELFVREVSPRLCRLAPPRWPAFTPECLAVIRAARRRRRRAA